MSKNKKSFTLIEMLIVIVIIGILAAALIPRLQSVQTRARDTKRKVDLTQIATALEIYKTDNSKYPLQAAYIYSTGAAPWLTHVSGYMTTLPVDPVNNSGKPEITGNLSYGFLAPFTAGDVYTLYTQLETRTDPERCFVKKWVGRELGGTFTWCGSYSSQIYVAGPYATTGS